MGFWNGYTDVLKGLLSIHDTIRDNFNGIADKLRKKSPQFRMFLDSDLGSPIEVATKKLWGDSIINGIRNHLPEGRLTEKLANGLGSWIGEKANSFMDRVKLLDHYRKGKITVDDYMRKRSVQVQGTLINIAQKAKKFAWIGRKAIYSGLEALGVPQPETTLGTISEATGVRWIVKKTTDGIEKLAKSEKARQLCERGITEFHAGVTKIELACRTVKKEVIDPVIEKTAELVEKTVDTVVDFGRKSFSAVKAGVQKVFKWLKSRIK